MPREQINTPADRIVSKPTETNGLRPGEVGIRFPRDGEGLSDGEHWENTPVVYVGWHKPEDHTLAGEPGAGCLQIHTIVDADEVLRAAEEIRRRRQNPASVTSSWSFSTVNLSRAEANKAIRVMRRARDAAYGSDE